MAIVWGYTIKYLHLITATRKEQEAEQLITAILQLIRFSDWNLLQFFCFSILVGKIISFYQDLKAMKMEKRVEVKMWGGKKLKKFLRCWWENLIEKVKNFTCVREKNKMSADGRKIFEESKPTEKRKSQFQWVAINWRKESRRTYSSRKQTRREREIRKH